MLPPHNWRINVSAGSYYPDLTQNFFGNDIELGYENDYLGMQFHAYSRHVDKLNDYIHVGQRLYSLELLLNGALRLAWGEATTLPVHFTDFSQISGNGQGSVYARIIEENPFDPDPAIDKELAEWNQPRKRFSSRLLNLSKIDGDLRALLFLVGLVSKKSPLECILTWGTLYKILDTIRHLSKANGFSTDAFANKQDVNAFTAACNNMSVLGVYARHGAAGNTPPTNVITDLDEAIKLIIAMADKFCRSYVAAKHP